jgi:hypothetical protein
MFFVPVQSNKKQITWNVDPLLHSSPLVGCLSARCIPPGEASKYPAIQAGQHKLAKFKVTWAAEIHRKRWLKNVESHVHGKSELLGARNLHPPNI